MKKFPLGTFGLFLLVLSVNSQPTWNKKITLNNPTSWLHDDTLSMGLISATAAADGNIFANVLINQNRTHQIIKINPLNGDALSKLDAGSWQGLSWNYPDYLRATADSGFVYVETWFSYASTPTQNCWVRKYDKSWNQTWVKDLANNIPPDYSEVFDLIINQSGNIYVMHKDSLLELNVHDGTTIRLSSTIHGQRIIEASNGDLIIRNDSIIERKTFNDSLLWSLVLPCRFPATCPINSPYLFVNDTNFVYKIDLSTGMIINSYLIPFLTTIEMTKDGGYITEGGTDKYDSNGNLQWSRQRSFPEYGLKGIFEFPDGGYLSGGTYRLSDFPFYPPMQDYGYSAFLMRVDSLGLGVIDSTNKIWPGDANDNHIIGFLDDALSIAQYNGYMGSKRDTCFPTQGFVPFDVFYEHSDYAVNWGIQNNLGVDLKYSDMDGNGIIDTTDISYYGIYPEFATTRPVHYRYGESDTKLASVNFRLIPEHDTVPPLSTIRLYMVAGASTALDSLNGICFTASYDTSIAHMIQMFPILSTLGDPTLDMVCMSLSLLSSTPSFLTCRTDFQNTYMLSDTIGIVELYSSAVVNGTMFHFDISGIKGINAQGIDVPLSSSGADVYIDPSLTGVATAERDFINSYPNPATNKLTLDFTNQAMRSISIVDAMGRQCIRYSSSETKLELDIESLETGIYFLLVHEGQQTLKEKFVVIK